MIFETLPIGDGDGGVRIRHRYGWDHLRVELKAGRLAAGLHLDLTHHARVPLHDGSAPALADFLELELLILEREAAL